MWPGDKARHVKHYPGIDSFRTPPLQGEGGSVYSPPLAKLSFISFPHPPFFNSIANTKFMAVRRNSEDGIVTKLFQDEEYREVPDTVYSGL